MHPAADLNLVSGLEDIRAEAPIGQFSCPVCLREFYTFIAISLSPEWSPINGDRANPCDPVEQ